MCLQEAFMLTVFGYGAPASDVEAVGLMRDAWGGPETRNLEETEIIDIREEDDLRQAWSGFIHSHHYRTSTDFYDSWIANHPRRSCEAMWDQAIEADFVDDNPLPADADWRELREWFQSLYEEERSLVS